MLQVQDVEVVVEGRKKDPREAWRWDSIRKGLKRNNI